MRQTPVRIDAYADTAGARLASTKDISGKQAGDPVRAADAMIALAESDTPPRHMVLGKWGLDAVLDRLKARVSEIERLRGEGEATDFPE